MSRRNRILAALAALFALGLVFSAWKFASARAKTRQAENACRVLRMAAQDLSAEKSAAARAASAPAPQNGTAEEEPAVPGTVPAEEESAPKRKNSFDISGLQEDLPELKGWLFSEGTGLDHPVMQGTDNFFYLNHLYDGTPNYYGSVFIDYRNSGLFTDDNTVIYGHNMDDGAMFSAVDRYRSPDFYEAHPTMTVYTPEGDYLIELLGGTVESGDYEFVRFQFRDFEDMDAYVADIRARSTFRGTAELQPGDRLLTLCTCTYVGRNTRYMLVGRVAEVYE